MYKPKQQIIYLKDVKAKEGDIKRQDTLKMIADHSSRLERIKRIKRIYPYWV